MWDSIGSLIPSPFFQFTESTPSPIGLITLGVKPAGKRSAVNLHAPFDVAGDGNLAYAPWHHSLTLPEGGAVGFNRLFLPLLFVRSAVTPPTQPNEALQEVSAGGARSVKRVD